MPDSQPLTQIPPFRIISIMSNWKGRGGAGILNFASQEPFRGREIFLSKGQELAYPRIVHLVKFGHAG